MYRKILVTLCLIGLIGCDDVAGPRDTSVYARLDSDGLAVSNYTDTRINYFSVEREMAARINWAPGCSTSPEAAIPRRETIRIPYSRIFGWSPNSSEVLVYWWRCVVSIEGQLEPAEIQHEIATR